MLTADKCFVININLPRNSDSQRLASSEVGKHPSEFLLVPQHLNCVPFVVVTTAVRARLVAIQMAVALRVVHKATVSQSADLQLKVNSFR